MTLPSFGLHPWYLTEDWATELKVLEERISQSKKCLIGECGLDRLCEVPYQRQLEAFTAQIALSERMKLPLVLHCVRAMDDVLRLKRGCRQPWIWHGFRGKPQQLRQLLSHDFFVSFGFRHNVESLRFCPIERLFLETDDMPGSIAQLYDDIAPIYNTHAQGLNIQLWRNAESLFQGR